LTFPNIKALTCDCYGTPIDWRRVRHQYSDRGSTSDRAPVLDVETRRRRAFCRRQVDVDGHRRAGAGRRCGSVRLPGAGADRLWFALGAPDPGAPPCMRQRFLPRTAGERHDPPERIFAPQRGLVSIGPVLRAWSLMPVLPVLRPRVRAPVRKGRAWGPSAPPSPRSPRFCPRRSRSHAA
jgi:hypothetical protein